LDELCCNIDNIDLDEEEEYSDEEEYGNSVMTGTTSTIKIYTGTIETIKMVETRKTAIVIM